MKLLLLYLKSVSSMISVFGQSGGSIFSYHHDCLSLKAIQKSCQKRRGDGRRI